MCVYDWKYMSVWFSMCVHSSMHVQCHTIHANDLNENNINHLRYGMDQDLVYKEIVSVAVACVCQLLSKQLHPKKWFLLFVKPLSILGYHWIMNISWYIMIIKYPQFWWQNMQSNPVSEKNHVKSPMVHGKISCKILAPQLLVAICAFNRCNVPLPLFTRSTSKLAPLGWRTVTRRQAMARCRWYWFYDDLMVI